MATTQANYVPRGYRPATKQLSLTQPGQVLSIRAIYDRFRRGQGVTTYQAGYNSDVPPGLENLNKLDRIDLMRQNSSNIAKIREVLSDQRNAAAQAKASQTQAATAAPTQESGAVEAPPAGGSESTKQQ